MTALDSDLTSIGYNLACATTQDAINTTMEYYVANLNGTIDWYNVYDRTTGTTVVMTAAQFQEICPVNPLTVPDGTTTQVGVSTDENTANLNALYNAGFEYGIQAVTGINAS